MGGASLEPAETYEEIGIEGPANPDHVPTMAGEDDDISGYETKGRLVAISYVKGVFDSKSPLRLQRAGQTLCLPLEYGSESPQFIDESTEFTTAIDS